MRATLTKIEQRKLHYIPISQIKEADEIVLVRQFFDAEKIRELSGSVGQKGVLQPILIRPDKNKSGVYEVVIGMRRFKSAILAGLQEIPCVIEDIDDREALELALTENIQREDLTPLEEAWALMKLIRNFNYTEKMICEQLKKSFSYVNSRLKLLMLPEGVQKVVSQGKLNLNQAIPLVELQTPREQNEMAEKIISQSLTAEDVRGRVKELKEAKRKEDIQKPTHIRHSQKDFSKQIDSGVKKIADVLRGLDFETMAFWDRQNIKAILSEFKGLIEGVIQKIDDAD